MISFKQWLNESNTEVVINPKSPADVFAQIQPEEQYIITRYDEKMKYTFKALYSKKQDKLYAWWVGHAVHGQIARQYSVPETNTSALVSEEFANWAMDENKGGVYSVMYFNAKTRELDILLGGKFNNKQLEKSLIKYITGPRLKKFLSKFKSVKYKFYLNTRFKEYY